MAGMNVIPFPKDRIVRLLEFVCGWCSTRWVMALPGGDKTCCPQCGCGCVNGEALIDTEGDKEKR